MLRTPLRVIFQTRVKDGTAYSYTHNTKVWQITEEGIATAAVLADAVDGVVDCSTCQCLFLRAVRVMDDMRCPLTRDL
jgi:hypothetical protein